MAQPGFEMLFANLQQIGFFEFFLPVVLFIAIYYGILNKMELLGEDEAVQGTAAIALSLLTVLGIYTVIPFSLFQQFFGALSVVLIVVIGFLVVLGMFGIEFEGEEVTDNVGVAIAAIVAVTIVIVVIVPPLMPGSGGIRLGEDLMNFLLTLILLIVLGVVVYAISSE
ncbi:MAG: hypothetical protein ABEJ66_01465 [Candidatus Nanohaloarchaea archaeon]